jgi:acetyl-CoA carboxylase, biotin carboxylase subunit
VRLPGRRDTAGERDCSIQRRNQKLVEKTPAPGLPRELLEEMRRAAVRGAKAAGYMGAATFEFLVDGSRGYYFMEVNSRVQVEHPVTEMVTGFDIVPGADPDRGRAAAVGAAGGRRAARSGHRVPGQRRGPGSRLRPGPGVLSEFVPPGGPFVRVDTHGFAGYKVPASYDSLLAKVITWAPDRAQAIARMRRALAEFRVTGPGVHTTCEFLDQVLADHEFADGKHDTSLVARLLEP